MLISCLRKQFLLMLFTSMFTCCCLVLYWQCAILCMLQPLVDHWHNVKPLARMCICVAVHMHKTKKNKEPLMKTVHNSATGAGYLCLDDIKYAWANKQQLKKKEGNVWKINTIKSLLHDITFPAHFTAVRRQQNIKTQFIHSCEITKTAAMIILYSNNVTINCILICVSQIRTYIHGLSLAMTMKLCLK